MSSTRRCSHPPPGTKGSEGLEEEGGAARAGTCGFCRLVGVL